MEARPRAADAAMWFEAVPPVPRVFSDCKLRAEEGPNPIQSNQVILR